MSWGAPAVANAVAGLKLIGTGEFRSPNFIRVDFISRIMGQETRGGDFDQLSFISFLYVLRVPSGGLIIRRDYRNDDLTGYAPMRDTALIGLRGPMNAVCLVIRFGRRKNLPNGCMLSIPCFPQLEAPKARKLCPTHAIWPAIAARAKCGGKAFPALHVPKCQHDDQRWFWET